MSMYIEKEQGMKEKRKKENSFLSFRFKLPFSKRGFTLIELLISVAIFVYMTGLLVAKYGNFNQSVLLTDLAYDVALTIRTAQTYGLSVKAVNSSPSPYQYAYGVDFSIM